MGLSVGGEESKTKVGEGSEKNKMDMVDNGLPASAAGEGGTGTGEGARSP